MYDFKTKIHYFRKNIILSYIIIFQSTTTAGASSLQFMKIPHIRYTHVVHHLKKKCKPELRQRATANLTNRVRLTIIYFILLVFFLSFYEINEILSNNILI